MRTDKIALLTDSCADIPVEVARKNHIYVVPFTITFEEGSYQDGVDIFPDDVYRRQPNEVIKTSLPSGAVVEDTLHKIKEDGYEKVIAIMLSSGLSGGYQIVRMLGEEEEALEVAVFDSMSGSLGEGAMVLTVARWIEEGRTWENMLACIPRMMKQVYPYFSVDTLEYLKRGGRIGKITAMAGTALGIKPILAFDPVSGELTSTHKVRGRQAAIKKLVQVAVSKLEPNKRYNIMWAHGGTPEEGARIAEMLREAAPDFQQEFSGQIDCTLASYVGPRLIGAAVQVLDDDM